MKKAIKTLSTLIPIIVLFTFIKVNANNTITIDSSKPRTTDTNSYYVTNQETFTITSVESNDKFKVYKILDTYYNDNTNVITYEFTNTFKSYLESTDKYKDYTIKDYQKLTSGSIESGSTKTTSTLDKLVSRFVSYIKTNSNTGTQMTTNGNTANIQLEAGSYLALPISTTKIYAVMVGNIEFSESGGEWILNPASIVAKKSNPGIYKTIDDYTSTTSSRNIDQDFEFRISLTIPQYPTNATNKLYRIEDILDPGITFNGISSMKIKDSETYLTIECDGTVKDENNNIVGSIVVNEQTITFDFNVDYITSDKMIIFYKSHLNDNATLGLRNSNNSTATLTYANDPYGTGIQNSSVNTKLYTYGLEILVYDSTDETKLLSNVTFDVQYSSWPYTKIATITTDQNGRATLKGIVSKTYDLKQTKTATGYILLEDSISATVNPNDSNRVAGTEEGYFLTKIAIDKIGLLPITGGSGIIIFVIFGVLFTLVDIVGFIIYRKKTTKKKNLTN